MLDNHKSNKTRENFIPEHIFEGDEANPGNPDLQGLTTGEGLSPKTREQMASQIVDRVTEIEASGGDIVDLQVKQDLGSKHTPADNLQAMLDVLNSGDPFDPEILTAQVLDAGKPDRSLN